MLLTFVGVQDQSDSLVPMGLCGLMSHGRQVQGNSGRLCISSLAASVLGIVGALDGKSLWMN